MEYWVRTSTGNRSAVYTKYVDGKATEETMTVGNMNQLNGLTYFNSEAEAQAWYDTQITTADGSIVEDPYSVNAGVIQGPGGTSFNYNTWREASDVAWSANNRREFDKLVEHYLKTGERPRDKDHAEEIAGYQMNDNSYSNHINQLDLLIKDPDFDAFYQARQAYMTALEGGDPNPNPDPVVVDETSNNPTSEGGIVSDPLVVDDPIENAKNAYFRDNYNLTRDVQKYGTNATDADMLLGNLENVFMNQAAAEYGMADVAYQQQAMQQAATVKQITDQVRMERMARLKAGMSESQIANQDMQMMMANVNTLNQNAAMLNQAKLQGQYNMTNAKDQAYLAFLQEANARGQVATGMYAADSGNIDWAARQYMNRTNGSYQTGWNQAQNDENK